MGLGIASIYRLSREALFLLHAGLTELDKVRLAIGLHALYNLVNHLRWREEAASFNMAAALRMFSKRAAAGSRAYILLAA